MERCCKVSKEVDRHRLARQNIKVAKSPRIAIITTITNAESVVDTLQLHHLLMVATLGRLPIAMAIAKVV
jgi:hypothetical protein